MHFLYKFMNPRAIAVHPTDDRQIMVNLVVWKIGIFRDQSDDIHPPAINAFLRPEFHYSVDLIANPWILPVKVGLLFGKQM